MDEAANAGSGAKNKEQSWRTELEAWRQSSLSQAEYQRQHGLTKSAFTYWKLKLLGPSTKGATLVAVPRRVVRSTVVLATGGGIRLRVAGGYVVELGQDFDANTLDRLLRMLERWAG